MDAASIGAEALWTMDDSIPFDLALLDGVVIPKELQAKVDAIFDDDPTPTDVLSAA